MKNITPLKPEQLPTSDQPKRISTRVRTAHRRHGLGRRQDHRRCSTLSRPQSRAPVAGIEQAAHRRAYAAARRTALFPGLGSRRRIKVALLDGASEHVGDDASTFVLGLAGIKPETAPTISLNIEVKAGYCRLGPRGILAAP